MFAKGMAKMQKKDIGVAHPSASILLISPQNRILLLQRVNTSTSFASAHVFPGGHVDPQDGALPPSSDSQCHLDSLPYRLAAIRECFEESGILLAHQNSNKTSLINLTDEQREEGRQIVHAQEIPFKNWLQQYDAIPDSHNLIPFTRWLTPTDIRKRFSTQMYIYFLPLDSPSLVAGAERNKPQHIPTPDGGVEHTAARFLYAQEWLDLALHKEIVLFPPQFVLLSLIAPFLSPPSGSAETSEHEALLEQRDKLKHWVETDGDPPWGEKCISPDAIKKVSGRYMIIGLDGPGWELQGTQRRGDPLRILKVELDREVEKGKDRPRPVELTWRTDGVREEVKPKL
ncbi:uncharacterized protein KY384_001439 [Bacidia gigantensis]|uniref:uncharacterized protein n=1 Tax=Bacidia gigantensis TaxID=2732470 RepID=UPI001D03A8A6|nr:uncharacterized protein KY384_001439 [Bacidia gigantensis]KAG8533698.1 hypothetical protein KY384_001439 [Bacidia gigantensis]